jgi:hypothetical protein
MHSCDVVSEGCCFMFQVVVGFKIDSCVGSGKLSIYIYFELWGFLVYVQVKKFYVSIFFLCRVEFYAAVYFEYMLSYFWGIVFQKQ